MGEDRIFQRSKSLSPEDRLTFDRWLKGNAIVGLILAAGLIAMAIAGSISGSHEPIWPMVRTLPLMSQRPTSSSFRCWRPFLIGFRVSGKASRRLDSAIGSRPM
jgi:hypothetical protein